MSRWIGRSCPTKSEALSKAPCIYLTMVDWPTGCLLGSPTLRVGRLALPSSLHLGQPSLSLCLPGLFITYVMLKSQRVTKKAQ